jgi:hypothetical protein
MEVDQILSDSLGYAKSNWGKLATLGLPILVIWIIFALGFVGTIFLGDYGGIVFLLTILLIFVLAILMGIFIYGYLFRVVKATLAGINEMPDFDDFLKLMVDGIKVFAVALIYGIFSFIVIMIISVIGFVISMLTSLVSMMPLMISSASTSYSDPASIIGILGMMVGYFIFFAIYLLIYLAILGVVVFVEGLIMPIGIANMALKGSFIEAFNFSDIRRRIDKIRWGKLLLWFVAIYFILIIGSYVASITFFLFVGFVLVPLLIIPYLAVFYARSLALLFEEGE